MAGEKFVALEETSQEIKTAVEGVSTSVTELKEDVGDGAGTDLVARVANLEAKVNSLQTTVESIPTSSDIATIVKSNAGSNPPKIKRWITSATSTNSTYHTISSGVTEKLMACCPNTGDWGIKSRKGTTCSLNGGANITLGSSIYDLPKDTPITIKNTGSRDIEIYGLYTLYEVE